MQRENLWAPWRIKYIQGLNEPHECFICHYLKHPENDTENLVLWRTDEGIVILNRYPYNNGHLLIAPVRHVGDTHELTDSQMLCLMKLSRDAQKALSAAINPHGFNIGANLGRCAGAGLPGHYHIHIVPRWDGDTNYMTVCSDTKVISQSLIELLELLNDVSNKHGLPTV